MPSKRSLSATWTILAGAACLLVVVAAGRPFAWVWHLPTWPAPRPPLATVPRPTVTATPVAPTWPTSTGSAGRIIAVVLAALVGAAIVGVLVWFVRRLVSALRDAHLQPTPAVDTIAGAGVADSQAAIRAVASGVDRALARLDAAVTAHDAVIAAWVALEEAAAEQGIRRSPAQTPTEFVAAVLATTTAPVAATGDLRQLYVRARFSWRPTSESDRAAARRALVAIATDLTVVAR